MKSTSVGITLSKAHRRGGSLLGLDECDIGPVIAAAACEDVLLPGGYAFKVCASSRWQSSVVLPSGATFEAKQDSCMDGASIRRWYGQCGLDRTFDAK